MWGCLGEGKYFDGCGGVGVVFYLDGINSIIVIVVFEFK